MKMQPTSQSFVAVDLDSSTFNPFHTDLASSGVTFKVARTVSELEQAFSLVHDSYVEAGLSEPKPSGLRLGLNHGVAGSAVIVATYRSQVVFTVSVLIDSWLGLPMDFLYKAELDTLRQEKRLLAEFGSLAFHKSFADLAPDLVPLMPAVLAHGLNLAAHYAIDVLRADDLVCACTPIHAAFYRRQVMFEPFGPERHHRDYVCGTTGVALRLNLNGLGERLRLAGQTSRRLKIAADYFHSHLTCVEWPDSPPLWTQDMLAYFFAQRTTLFYHAPVNDVTRLLRDHRLRRLDQAQTRPPLNGAQFARA